MSESAVRCGKCRFYEAAKDRFGGDCKLFPQTVQKGEHDWCGQWKAASKISAKE